MPQSLANFLDVVAGIAIAVYFLAFLAIVLWRWFPPSTSFPTQFRLQTLLLSFVVVWSSLAAFGLLGIMVAAVLLLIGVLVRHAASLSGVIVFVLCALVFGMCLFSLLLPAVRFAQETTRSEICRYNLKQIAFALHSYHSSGGCFPPAYIAGPDGKPMHSWRVLILPHIGEQALYNKYDFAEPWDGPNNSKLAAPMPALFRCPGSEDENTTDYVAVVGPETAWPGAKPATMDDIHDGTRQTIMLVEVANSSINWMEPKDVSFDQVRRTIDPASTPGVSHRHTLGYNYFYHDRPAINVGFADGHVDILPLDISPENLASLLTRDGGEEIGDIRSMWPHFTNRLHWSRIISLIVLALSYAILLFRPRQKSP